MTDTTDLQPTWTTEQTTAFAIQTAEQYVAVSERRLLIKQFQKQVKAWFHGTAEEPGPTARAWESWQQLLERERTAVAAANTELVFIDAAIVAFDDAKEQEQRAQEEALAEQQRLEEQNRRLEEALTRDADAQQERDPSLKKVLLAEVEDVLTEPAPSAAVLVPKSTPIVRGVTPTFKEKWRASDGIDIRKLAAGVASGRYPVTYLLANVAALELAAESSGGTVRIDGVQFYKEKKPVTPRGRR